eukprot:375030_1
MDHVDTFNFTCDMYEPLIVGYIRMVTNRIFEDGILNIVSRFLITDIFDANHCSRHLNISNSGQTVTKCDRYKAASAFGTIWINSTDQRIFEWIFKIQNTKWNSLVIGIGSNDKLYDGWFCFNKRYLSYVFNCTGKIAENTTMWQNYSNKFDRIDTIIMILNLCARTISFSVDGKCLGNAFTYIIQSKDIQYKMGVVMHHKGDSIKLESFGIREGVCPSPLIHSIDNAIAFLTHYRYYQCK